KGRAPAQPAAVMFFSQPAALAALPELEPPEIAAMRALLPGPLTLLLPNRRHRFPLACDPRAAQAGVSSTGAPSSTPAAHVSSAGAPSPPPAAHASTLGLRVPALPEPLAALAAVDLPLLQSSANLSGGPDARRLADVPESIRAGADLVLDGGELPGVASTVLDLRRYASAGEWTVVREGPMRAPEIASRLAESA
ncbi:MAG TPA: Sua5/YciO/YrdC/YwlC family protein, partial [Solirubrobacteraceae bacterium]|nr:Sua5/YciO/YrdC/YwlC family protein [Solirubrobacteraceae bacterium]